MSIFDKYSDLINASFSKWIKIEDNESKWTIENFQYNTGVNDNITYPHCWKCVTINKCWFKNESNKKPEEFDYSFTGISKKLIGLYHPRCHCKKLANDVPKIKEIIILDVRSKFNDFFKRKKGIFYGIGYTYKDEEEIINLYINQVKNSYRSGNYFTYKHWQYGFQINIIISIAGKNEYKDIIHNFKTGLIIYPNGKLRISTIFAGGVQ